MLTLTKAQKRFGRPVAWRAAVFAVGSLALMRAGSIAAAGPYHAGPQHLAEAYMGKGYEELQQERYLEAVADFQKALQENPDLARAQYQLGVCLFAVGRFDSARKQFKMLASRLSDDPPVNYYLGRLDLVQGNSRSAVRRLSAIAAAAPFADTDYYLGSAYLESGDLKNAEYWLKNALRADPKDFRVPDHLARVYQREKRPQQAELEYRISARLHQYYDERSAEAMRCAEALDSTPIQRARTTCKALASLSDPDMLTLLGMLYGKHGDYTDALPPLARAAGIDPDAWEIQHNLGLTYFRLKRYPDAVVHLQKAVSMRPDYFGSNALLGASLYTLHQDNQAFHVLTHAHQLNPSDRDTALLLVNESLTLAGAAYHARDYVACIRYLHVASSLRPGDPQIRRRLNEVERLCVSEGGTIQ